LFSDAKAAKLNVGTVIISARVTGHGLGRAPAMSGLRLPICCTLRLAAKYEVTAP